MALQEAVSGRMPVENSERKPGASLAPAFLPYLLKAALMFGAIAAAVQFVDRCGVWLFSLLCLLLAVPIFCQRAYFQAIRRSHWLSVFREGGRVRRYLSGIVWRLIVSALAGLVLAFVMVFRLRALSWQEWLTYAAAIPVFWTVAHFAQKFAREADTRFHYLVRVKSASWLAVPILLLIYGVLIVGFPSSSAEKFASWIHQGSGDRIVSATVGELNALHEGWRALEAFVLGRVSDLGEWGWAAAVMIFVVGNAAFFYGCASTLAVPFIPQTELSRAFCRVATSAEPTTKPTLAGVAIGSALFTIFACFLYFPGAAMLEASLMQLPPEHRPMHQVRKLVAEVKASLQPHPVQVERLSIPPLRQAGDIALAVEVNPRTLAPVWLPRQPKILAERIGSRFYRPGTIKETGDARMRLLSSRLKDLDVLKQEINRGFDLMEDNIDVFLDWYYSLPAEYARLAKLLTGSFEGYLTEKFSTILSQEAPFEQFERTFAALLESEPALRRAYQETIERILSRNSVTIDHPARMIVTDELDDPSAIFSYKSVIASARVRLQTSGFAGVAGASGGAVMGKKIATVVAKKLATKSVFKAAVKVAAKVATKAASVTKAAAIGTAVGGTVGSFVPIVGTAVGAAVGGVIGALGFGVGVDALLLELDESMNRSEFRVELIEALNLERRRMLDAIAPSVGE